MLKHLAGESKALCPAPLTVMPIYHAESVAKLFSHNKRNARWVTDQLSHTERAHLGPFHFSITPINIFSVRHSLEKKLRRQ